MDVLDIGSGGSLIPLRDMYIGLGRYFSWSTGKHRLCPEGEPDIWRLALRLVPCLRGIPINHPAWSDGRSLRTVEIALFGQETGTALNLSRWCSLGQCFRASPRHARARVAC